ncbi:MAG: glycoside hydrolase family 1 protein [Mycoplasmatales bacterium]
MKYKFPEKFWWGAATSGIQTEGNKNQVNQSIWELWYEKNPEQFSLGIGPHSVCETYSRYEEDVELMQKINLNSLRTSIQWSRLIKDFETFEVDQDAVVFYKDYFHKMREAGVEPVVNLYHFDMPRILQEQYGGFESKHVVDLFVGYARKVFELFNDDVKFFTTFNEPIVPVEGGYFYNFHYPNVNDAKTGIQVAFNTMIAHAKVVHAFKAGNFTGEIGVILNLTPSYPKSDDPLDLEAAHLADLFFNRSFLDPFVKGQFPNELKQILAKYEMLPDYTRAEVETIITSKVDFLGVNYYVPRRVQAKDFSNVTEFTKPEDFFDYYINETGRFNAYRDNNEIWPIAVYDIAKNIQENYGNIKWFLAEIGIAMDEASEGKPINGIIQDQFRTELLKEHLKMLHKAIIEGANCFGVHMWTFIDCWSWKNSFVRRYGFYRLELETKERIIKANALWFKEVIADNGFDE